MFLILNMPIGNGILNWLYRSPSYSDAESSTAKTIWINVKIQESLPRQ